MERGINKKRSIASLAPAGVIFAAIILLALSNILGGEDWTRWRGLHGNGISHEKGWNPKALQGGAKISWKIKIANGYSSVSIYKSRLYTMGNSHGKTTLYCLQAETGEEIWRFSYPCKIRGYDGSFSTPVVDGDFVYSMSREGGVYCNDIRKGNKIWFVDITDRFKTATPKYGYSGSPVIDGSRILLNACSHGVALDKTSGKTVWASPPGKAGYATPVLYTDSGRQCAVIFSHRRLNGIDRKTGKLLWTFPWIFNDGADSADPVVVGHQVFISTAYRNGATMIDFTDNNPQQKWFKKDIQDEFGSSIYKDGYLYVPHGDTRHRTAYLKCIEFTSGREMWCRDTGHCSLILVNGLFVVLNQWGDLTIMEASKKGYKDVCRAKVVKTSRRIRCWTAPVLANGKIYVRTNVGDLVCIDVSY